MNRYNNHFIQILLWMTISRWYKWLNFTKYPLQIDFYHNFFPMWWWSGHNNGQMINLHALTVCPFCGWTVKIYECITNFITKLEQKLIKFVISLHVPCWTDITPHHAIAILCNVWKVSNPMRKFNSVCVTRSKMFHAN